MTVDEIPGEVERAAVRLHGKVRETPLEFSPHLSKLARGRVYLKLENYQLTHSFKIRGALNKLLALSPGERSRGVITASTGNHGAAVAYAATSLGIKALIFVPDGTSANKSAMIRDLGGEVRCRGEDCVETERYARDFADRRGLAYISPYNDPLVIAGQGTIAEELARQLDRIDVVVASMGGGGLISGIAGYLTPRNRRLHVIACSPENSPVMAESIRTGHIVQMESKPTLSDSTAGGVDPDSITFDLCRGLIDQQVLVSESEIAGAIRLILDRHRMLIEGAAGVAVAGFLKVQEKWRDRKVVIVLCGANIDSGQLQTILPCSNFGTS